jgi:mono/diheme cytochrome c family protein
MEANNSPEPQNLLNCHKREHGEPTDHVRPVSMVILTFICALFFWVGVYITMYSGNFDPFVFDETQRGGAAVEPPAPPEPLPVLGKKIFTRNCVQCHQADGKGVEGAYPPLVGSPYVTGSAERMAKIILNGLAGRIDVLGKEYNGNMPAWDSVLNDRQIAAVMTYLRTKEEWGHAASEITPEEIAALRASVGKRGPWSPEELLKLYPLE